MQVDTVHFMREDGTRFYVFTLIDLYSRAAYAEYSSVCTQRVSYRFILRAQDYLGIPFTMLQADNGPEFGRWLHDQLGTKGIALRHSRVRTPNDNAHVERFNRTIRQECLSPLVDERKVPNKLQHYLLYYNQFRRHSGISGGYPLDMLGWKPSSTKEQEHKRGHKKK